MSRKEFSYRRLYNAIEKASTWQAIDLWTPQGCTFSGRWVIDATKLPKWIPLAVRGEIDRFFPDANREKELLNPTIRYILMHLENNRYVTFTPATQPYTQLAFYHPKA